MLDRLFSRRQDATDSGASARAKAARKVTAKLARNPLVERVLGDYMELFIRPDFVSAEECAHLCRMIDANAQPSRLYSGTQNADYRTSSSAFMGDADPVVTAIDARIVALLGIEAAHGEPIQGQKYEPGQHYRPHCDYFPPDHPLWAEAEPQGGQRCWTAMAYLSDVEAGGETGFVHAKLTVPPSRGTLVVWNNLDADGEPNTGTLHEGCPVTRGTKYIVTKWFRERAWTPVYR